MIHDIETMADDIETFLKANLNTEIGNVNTEKADSITLKTVDSGAYIFQFLNNKVSNFSPFVFYMSMDPESVEGIGPSTGRTLKFLIVICLPQSENDQDNPRVMLRYGRSLQIVFEQNYDRISRHATFKVDTLSPVSFKLSTVEGTEEYNAVGVVLSTDQY